MHRIGQVAIGNGGFRPNIAAHPTIAALRTAALQ